MKLLRTSLAGRSDAARLRDAAIMELFYASGMRRAELAGVQLGGVDLAERTIRVTGKGNKERLVVINHAAAEAIEAYLRVRPRSAGSAPLSRPWRQGAHAEARLADLPSDLQRQRYSEARYAPHAAPFVCYASGRERCRPRNRARATRSRKSGDDRGLPAVRDGS